MTSEQHSEFSELREQERVYFDRWVELVEYQESLDMLLDEVGVPRKYAGGAEMHLRARLQTLIEKANQRSRLAYQLFQQLDKDYGNGVRNGYFPGIQPLLEAARKEFEVAP